MRLLRLTLENVRSYQHQDIIFPVGATLLAGDVGAGKTTILMAIEFAFFGLQPGQRGASLVTNGKDEASVELEFELDGNPIIIERRLRRATKGVNQEYSALTINGHKEEMSVSELKIRLLTLLGYPEEFLKKTNLLYRYTVYSPQEEMKQIIMEDAETRLNSLRYIFGIEKYRKIKENLGKTISYVREKSKILQGEMRDIELLKNRVTTYLDLIESLDEQIKKVSKGVVVKRELLKTKEEELKKIEENVQEKQRIDKEVEKSNVVLRSKLQTLAEYELQYTELQEGANENKKEFSQKHYTDIISALMNNREKADLLQAKLIEYTGKVSSLALKQSEERDKTRRIALMELCPTCLQHVSQTHKHVITSENEKVIVTVQRQLEELNSAHYTIEKELLALRAETELLQQTKFEFELLKSREQQRKVEEKKIEELKKKIEAAKKDVAALEEHSAHLKQSNLTFSKYEKMSQMKEEEVRQARQEEKSEEIKAAELRKEKEIRAKEIELTRNEIARKEASRQEMLRLTELESWLSDNFNSLVNFLERNILLKVRQEFSKRFNEWFRLLTSESFFAHLDENFTPIILQGNYETEYEFLSGGERTAVALAYRLALNQIINKVYSMIRTKDLLILDEPTDGFSEQQLDRIRDIIPELDVEQVLIVSHEQKIESFVDNVVRIRKQGTSSVIN